MARAIDHANNAAQPASKSQNVSTYPMPNKAPFPARQAAAQPQHGVISQGGATKRELTTEDHNKTCADGMHCEPGGPPKTNPM